MFRPRTEQLAGTFKRMSAPEQRLAVDMHAHYEREFGKLERAGEQQEGMANGVLRVIDMLMARQAQRRPDLAAQVKCHRGCSACCHVNVTITKPEAVLLHAYAQDAGIELDRAKLERQAAHAGLVLWHQQPIADQACVFLDEDGACRVYEYRPAACRKYLVITDPELCDHVKHPKHPVGMFVSVETEVVASAALTVWESGNLAAMLLKHEPKHEPSKGLPP